MPDRRRRSQVRRARVLCGVPAALAALAALCAVSPAATYATSVAGCIAAGFSDGKPVVAGAHAGEFRCIGATPTEQVMLDTMWREPFTVDQLTAINALISTVPDFDSMPYETGGYSYFLTSRLVGGDRYIDVSSQGAVVGTFGEVGGPGFFETNDLNINGSGDPLGGRYHTYNGILTDEDCNADMIHPFGVLDFSDVIQFLSDFAAGEPTADIAPPADVYDFSDVVAYLGLFASGCP